MPRKLGDPCPYCKVGKLTVHPERKISENPDGSSEDHRTWLCDKCEETTRDFSIGLVDKINISDSIKKQKSVSRNLKDKIDTSDDLN